VGVGSLTGMKEWQPLVAGLGVALALMGLFVASYAEALSAPKPHEVPFGVAGSANTQLINRIEQQAGTALKIKTYKTEADMRDAIDQQDIFGAISFTYVPFALIAALIPAARAAGISPMHAVVCADACPAVMTTSAAANVPAPSRERAAHVESSRSIE